MLWGIILGGVAGWIASMLMNAKKGLLRYIVLGIVGGFVGNILAGAVGLGARNSIGSIIISVVGACVIILLGRWLFGKK
ncbi:MAG: GlsB/YeaQ/YmgE family stress response membrane protein [Oscillospiraceae bacterium]|nr:GlsB/YeaQ/YmgE family stress response membrane protein [Oscillospiraceae bacterium]